MSEAGGSAKTKPLSRGMLAIYDDKKCIGHLLIRHRAGVEAFDSDDHSLGVYPDIDAAADAVSAKAAR
jgi:hypothetical protein